MPEFFHVDGGPQLSSGQVLDVDNNFTGWPLYALGGYYSDADLANFARGAFPGGLSDFGKHFLLRDYIGGGAVPYSPAIEVVFELVRRQSFPDCPSRVTSVFAWSSLDDARWFKAQYRNADAPIFRVSCTDSFRCDFQLVKMGFNTLASWLLATKYWSGVSTPTPRWEQLLVPPVRVGNQVE